jgi:Spy/CpxP family protein refolding chaperone
MRLIHRILVLAMCTFSVGLWAQAPSTKTSPQFKPEPMPMPLNRPVNADDHLHMLSQQLSLTKAQQAKIRPILEQYLRQRQEIELNEKFSPDEKSAKLQSSEHASHSRIRALLTATQKKKFDDIMGTSDVPPQHASTAKKQK